MIDAVWSFLSEPWRSGEWMARASAASLLVSCVASPVGVALYLRRQSMLADALAHIALPGIVFAFLLTGSLSSGTLLVGAAITGVVASWVIEVLSKQPHIRPDAAIGIVFTSLFALGVLLLSSQLRGIHLDLDHALYGNVLGVTDASLRLLAILAPLWLAIAVIGRRVLALVAFDPRYAATLGVRAGVVGWVLTGLASVSAVASFEAVGAVLGVAMFVVPAATAHRVARSVTGMLVWALGFACLASIVGLYASIAADCSTSGAIATAAGLQYALVFLFGPTYGVLRRPPSASP